MPDEDAAPAVSNHISRIGEQVARMDGRMTGELGALKSDMEAMRRNQHDANNTMTEAVAMYRMQAKSLDALHDGHRALTEAMGQMKDIATKFMEHVKQCDKRGARMEKLAWAGLTLMLGVISFLLKEYMARH